jgi:hypothetical protein
MKWINVEAELPTEYHQYLIAIKDQIWFVVAYYHPDSKIFCEINGGYGGSDVDYSTDEVTHWMKIDQPL